MPNPESSPASQIGAFIEKADTLFAQEDLVDAALLYWRVLQALETAEKEQICLGKRGVPNKRWRSVLHANLRIAEIYSRSSWLKDAKARLEHAARIQPDHADVRLLRGKLLRDEGLDDESIGTSRRNEFLAVLENAIRATLKHTISSVSSTKGTDNLKKPLNTTNKAIENDPDLRDVATEKAPIGILARLQLSRTYNKMLQGYQFLGPRIHR